MDLNNSEARYDLSQVPQESVTFLEDPDEGYFNFVLNMLHHHKDSNSKALPLHHKDLMTHDHHLVEMTENEVFNAHHCSVNVVEGLDDDDPQYKLFLSHVKSNGKSFTFQMEQQNGPCKIIEYHKQGAVDGRIDLKKDGNNDNVVERKSIRSMSEPRKSKKVTISCLRSPSPEKRNTPRNRHAARNQSLSRFQPKSKKDGLAKMGEELRPGSSGKINLADNDGCLIHEDFGTYTYELKEKLMTLLRKPFDEQEYNTLRHQVTQKKYKLRHRELEDGREKSVITKIKAKSYLRRYKDFRQAIEAVAADKFKELNILRGFFFWLQHLPWAGGRFKPWEDASCLAVMPGSQ